MNQEVYDMAKKYRAIGWQVVPLFGYTKIPSSIPWKEYQERLATDEEFERWFTAEDITGLGLITGKLSGIVVLDEDLYKEGGIPVRVKTGMLVETARGGKHHYFRYVEPIKSSSFRKGINVEIKADGGFVVLPPTQFKVGEDVKTYKWIDTCMPEELMEIRESMLIPYRGESVGKGVDIMELSGSDEGNRHNSLRSIALSLFARFKKREWQLAEDMVWIESQKTTPPHPTEDVKRIIRDAKHFITTHNKEKVDEEIENEPVLPSALNELVKERLKDRELEKIAPKTGWPDLDAIIKGFIPGHIYTLTGDTNVGKTMLACNFAEALRKQGKKTLYIALEPDVNVVEYLASVRLQKRFDQLTDDDLYLKEEDNLINVFLHKDIGSVEELVRALRKIPHFDLIIIDHIGYFVRTDHDWIQQQSNVIKEIAFLAKENKVAIMMIAHLRKPNIPAGKNKDWTPTQNDIMGSAAFKQDSTEVLIAYRQVCENGFGVEFQDTGNLIVSKTKVGPNGGVMLLFSERSAKIWSQREIDESPVGAEIMKRRQQEALARDMQMAAPWGGKKELADDD